MIIACAVGCTSSATDEVVRDDRAGAFEPVVTAGKGDADVDICALAAQLPDDDICSLICDYDAFAQRAREDGMEPGACYTFRCTLPGEVGVNVGVCAPPE